MILLIAFSKYSKLQPLMKLLQVLEVQSSGTPFLEQMEAKLNYIGKNVFDKVPNQRIVNRKFLDESGTSTIIIFEYGAIK